MSDRMPHPPLPGRLSGVAPARVFARPAGFTLVEVLVTIIVLALFTLGVTNLYRQSMQSYRITTWKQERTRQAEMFWNRLRKPLEEASDQLARRDLGAGRWTIDKTSRPLQFNPSPGDGKFMAWQIDHFDSATGLVEGPTTWSLSRAGREIRMSGPGLTDHLVLEDVDTVSIKATQIRQRDGTFEEELDLTGAGTDPVIGAVLEVSFILTPPEYVQNSSIRVVQNAKFKLVVEAESTTSPSY
ncbi:MAG: prepilin-type N-terminal cleavage/methylation domain-containing protein [Candidatus Riflebacteria bacterium]|nr:prepilin-type N-terminal cleavage/methylation domain-containing protein [Candidatus Riflebacteria bacterium]